MLDRNLVVDLDGGIQRAGQRHVFDDRNVVLAGDFPDPERDVVHALGHADRRRHAALVGQRDRIVRRVGDDDRGLRHRSHQALLHAREPQLPDPGLDVRIAFRLLELLLDLPQRHLLPFEPLPVLQQVVSDRDQREHRDHRTEQLQRQRFGGGEDGVRIEPHQGVEPRALRPQHRRHDRAERQHLEKSLGEVRCCLLTENPLGAGNHRNLAELRLQRLPRPDEAVLNDIAGNGSQHQQQQRHAERGDKHVFDLHGQRQQTRPVGPDLPGVGDQVA